jgi:hypothetical protein
LDLPENDKGASTFIGELRIKVLQTSKLRFTYGGGIVWEESFLFICRLYQAHGPPHLVQPNKTTHHLFFLPRSVLSFVVGFLISILVIYNEQQIC